MTARPETEDDAGSEASGYHRQPSSVAEDGGNIIIDGPDGVAVTMSPEAAEETARRLVEAVEKARADASGVTPDQR